MTYEDTVKTYNHNLEQLRNTRPYSDEQFERMVQKYFNELKTIDVDLARRVAMDIIGYSAYTSLSTTQKSALITNITHGKIDTA